MSLLAVYTLYAIYIFHTCGFWQDSFSEIKDEPYITSHSAMAGMKLLETLNERRDNAFSYRIREALNHGKLLLQPDVKIEPSRQSTSDFETRQPELPEGFDRSRTNNDVRL